MFSLEGRVALITGASGGIGADIAHSLHAQGAIVGLSGTRRAALEELAHTLGGERLAVLPVRLDQPEGPAELIAQAEKQLDRVDILINNAGVTRDTLLMRMKDEDWDTVLQVNLTSVFRLCRESIRGMMKRRWGRIINMSSIVGKTGNAGQTNYAASKAALEGFGKSLALEVASRGITVNAIAPGFIETPMTGALTEEQKGRILTEIPMGKIGSPADIAAGVVFLASDEASYVTGQTLHINGGMVMP